MSIGVTAVGVGGGVIVGDTGGAGVGGAPIGVGGAGVGGGPIGVGGGTVVGGCVVPMGPSITAFNQAGATGAWNDPSTGLSGNLFLNAPLGGSFSVHGMVGTGFEYQQQQDVYGQYANDASFGVHFTGCVNASPFSGLAFEVNPVGVPAGSDPVLQVLTVSNTPAPYGKCVALNPGDCAPLVYDTGGATFGSGTPYTVTWDQLAGGNPPEPGKVAATEIVGLAWVINEWIGPPPEPAGIVVQVNNVAFIP